MLGVNRGNMPILDCENIDSLKKSIEKITSIKSEEVIEYLSDFDLNKFYKDNDGFQSPDVVFLDLLKNRIGSNISYSGSYWFHVSHFNKVLNFENGLLPLHLIIDKIWDYLFTLSPSAISKKMWENTRALIENDFNESHHAELYRDRIRDLFQSGPYGFLAKDLPCFDNKITNLHYFKGPEIVIDICECSKIINGFDLLSEYKKESKPCIVKFYHDDNNIRYLGDAMFYLYQITKNEIISFDENVRFSPRGQIIESKNIVKIELMDVNT